MPDTCDDGTCTFHAATAKPKGRHVDTTREVDSAPNVPFPVAYAYGPTWAAHRA